MLNTFYWLLVDMEYTRVSPVKNVQQQRRQQIDNTIDEENILYEVKNLLEQLSQMRLIEFIARPTKKVEKEKRLEEFLEVNTILNGKLNKIHNEVKQRNTDKSAKQNNNFRGKSISVGEMTSKHPQWKKAIRAIQSKYYEVFYEGNFKYFKRIAHLLELPQQKVEVIDIESWASQCLQQSKQTSEGCCD